MAETTDHLIERLAAQAVPVRRLRPPLLRSVMWLAAVGVLATLAIIGFADLDMAAQHFSGFKFEIEVVATLATGLAAVIAAFHLSLPDRTPAWSWVPLPFLAVWIASSGYSCYRNWIRFGPDGWALDESATCFGFILIAGIPLSLSLLVMLRRAYPLAPTRVAAVAGLGVAGIAAFLLQFFHPFDVTFLDLAVHAVSIALVIIASSVAGRWPPREPA